MTHRVGGRRQVVWFHGLVIACLLTSVTCSIPISYYDSTTYSQLTSLKVDIVALVESFDSIPLAQNEERIEEVRIAFLKALEYERGKGDINSDTHSQFEKIHGLFDESVADYRENGPGGLGDSYFNEKAKLIGQAFDIAIRTENEKNKDKR